MKQYKELSPPPRTIMTPGPVEVDPRVLRALSYPILGQFDPAFTELMNETMEMLRGLFVTDNQWCYPIDGTSRSGLEAVLVSIIEPGDRVLVPIYGRFGHLLTEIAERCGAEVMTVETEWGTVFQPEQVKEAILSFRPAIVAMVHGETSTGCMQPLREIGHFCREHDVLFVVDAVATIGGVPLYTDDWKLDAVIGGTQKCLSVPSGMAPITYNERIERKILARKSIERGLRTSVDEINSRRISSNYFDLAQLQDYWSPARLNHHTEATSMLYGLREGLRILHQEGLDARFERHRQNGAAIVAGVKAMGLELFGGDEQRLPVVTCIEIPAGIDGERVRSMLLNDFGIEIASSFGPLKGRIWRIGSMGYSSSRKNVLHVLGALEATLLYHGVKLSAGAGVQAALQVYAGKEEVTC
ncbi:alanine--glyoxylate aminotransferase family protein [Paenibacillus campi]|uniref:pyridoxal-phosphate-dependent aminotransferase family protein n=1 Tax=Paenibacillus campi TaxID=3106031 RepID=UPI002AFECD0A|nr:alanine--glyoxylate aminotransferase family protein [Paenibacillus sp. SGZ-1014]